MTSVHLQTSFTDGNEAIAIIVYTYTLSLSIQSQQVCMYRLLQICDLGSARILEHTTHQTTAVGTYAWMSPEVYMQLVESMFWSKLSCHII